MRRERGHAKQTQYRGEKELVLGDVNGELVVGDLYREERSMTACELVTNADAATHQGQGI